jgi:hypothetical protein
MQTKRERNAKVTDDSTIDISNRLPPIEVRKPWRQKLPRYYVGKIDALKGGYVSVHNLIAILAAVRRDFPDDDVPDRYSVGDVERAAKSLDDALVLLKCAEEKLWSAVPVEEFMTREDLQEFGRG